MNRKIKTIKLSIGEVDIISFLTWGEKEQIQANMIGGVQMDVAGTKKMDGEIFINAKYKLAEICIKEIRIGEKENIKFSKEWMSNLSVDDGNLLYEEIENLSKKK